MTTIGRRALRGTVWLSVANYGAYVAALVADILLARLLFPEDFGTVALAVSVLEIAGQLTSLGLGVIIVQYKPDDDLQEQRFLSTVFWIQTIAACSILGIILLLSLVLRQVFDPVVIPTLIVLAVGRGVQILNQIPSSLMQKRMMFKQSALISFLSLVGSAAFSVLLAWRGCGFWSLVARRLSQVALSGIGVWAVVNWHPKLIWDRQSAQYVWRFARSLWLNSNLEVLLKDLDDAAVGSVNSSEALGYYSKAYKLSRLFIEFVAPAIARTSLPAYSKLQDDPVALSSVFQIVQRVLARLSALFYLEIGILAPTVVSLLYGEQWLPMVTLFRLMIVYAFLFPLFDQQIYLLLALERPHVVARIRLIQTLFFAPAVFIAAYLWNGAGVAVVVDLTIVIGMILLIRKTKKLVTFSFVRAVLPSIFSGLVTTGVTCYVQQLWNPKNPWIEFIALALLMGGLFVTGLLVSEGQTLFKDIKRIRRGLLGTQSPGDA